MQVIILHPVSKFFRNLDKNLYSKIKRHIVMLEEYEYSLAIPFSKKIADSLYELRILGDINVRILYTFYDNKAVLLHGFVKKTQKLPKKDLKLGIKRLKSLTRYNM